MSRCTVQVGRPIVVALALGLAATGCAASGAKSASSTTTPSTDRGSLPPPGSVRIDDTRFCRLAASMFADSQSTSAPSSPAVLRRQFAKATDDEKAALAAAPAAIRPQVQAMATAESSLAAAMAQAGYQPADLPPNAVSRFDSAYLDRATEDVGSYMNAHCSQTATTTTSAK